jgi:hypothetical protein
MLWLTFLISFQTYVITGALVEPPYAKSGQPPPTGNQLRFVATTKIVLDPEANLAATVSKTLQDLEVRVLVFCFGNSQLGRQLRPRFPLKCSAWRAGKSLGTFAAVAARRSRMKFLALAIFCLYFHFVLGRACLQ